MSASYDDEISILTLALILAPLLAFISTLFYTHTSIQFALSRSATNRKTLLASFPPSTILLGFFHPFCNAGGGGERVIWTAVAYMQRLHPDVVSVVYTGDWPGASKEEILARASRNFNIDLSPSTIFFVPLPSRKMISDSYWNHLTLVGQAYGSLVCCWEALLGRAGLVPDVFIDTMGYGFTFPFATLLGKGKMPVGAYVHYPTISTDMLDRVRTRKASHTNVSVAGSVWKSWLKLIYYRIFAKLYTFSLGFATVRVANSTWTKAHLDSLLASSNPSTPDPVNTILYPPCDTTSLTSLPISESGREPRTIVSLAQFRPEKDHPAQLQALKELLDRRPEWKEGQGRAKLVMIGSCRDGGDEVRVEGLRKKAREFGIEDNVEIVVNASYDTLLARLGSSSVGLATMADEHFGINVVEFMAAGLIPLSHASAGPLLDIIVPYKSLPTGFHAIIPREFADRLEEIFDMPAEKREEMRKRTRESVEVRFGVEVFEKGWEGMWKELCEERERLAAEAEKEAKEAKEGKKKR